MLFIFAQKLGYQVDSLNIDSIYLGCLELLCFFLAMRLKFGKHVYFGPTNGFGFGLRYLQSTEANGGWGYLGFLLDKLKVKILAKNNFILIILGKSKNILHFRIMFLNLQDILFWR